MVRPTFGLLTLTFSLTAFACGGASPTDVSDDERSIKPNPSFASDVNEILQRRGCASGGCHGNGAGGLRLTASASANYGTLVGVDAASEAVPLVDPGDAANSYVVIKTEGRQNVGQRMPLGASPLDDIDQTNLRNWIDNGAPNN